MPDNQSHSTYSPQSLLRFAKLMVLLGVFAILQGCSTIKVGYNNASSLGYWWLDGYADFNDAQYPLVHDELDRLMKWHRAVELPKVAELLQKMQPLLTNDVTPAQVCAAMVEGRARVDAVAIHAIPGMVAVAQTITAEQRQHIKRKLEKNNLQWTEDWNEGTPEERTNKRLKATVERAEQLYDTMEEKQISLLRQLDATSGYDADLSFKERLRRQADLLQTLARINPPNPADKPGTAQATLYVMEYLARNTTSPDPVYRAFSEKMYAESCNAFAIVHNSTTAKQRERAVKRLAAYARDARELAEAKDAN